MRSPVMIDAGNPVSRVYAPVYNFGDRGLYDVPQRKLVLRDGDWSLELIAVSDFTVQFPPDLQNDTLRITHSLSINKDGNSAFTANEAEEKLTEVVRFLSFCHGQRVGYGNATGIGADGVKTVDFLGTSHASPYSDGDSWLDRHKARGLPDLYSAFLKKIRSSPVWDDMFRASEYWLGRANTTFTGPDGGVILTQAALERISWEVLTQPPFSLPIKDADALKASGRLRKLLEEFHIPTSVPAILSELSALVSREGWKDGPDAFVKVRNEMVHPRRKISARIPYYECFVLGKWYADLSLLALLGYKGEYSNRTKIRRWVGETEPVPWL